MRGCFHSVYILLCEGFCLLFFCFSVTSLKTSTLVSEIQREGSQFLPSTFISQLNREQVGPITSKLMSGDGKIQSLHGKLP